MYREDWSSVFKNQDRILQQLKPLDSELFLAGGTGIQRYVLNKPYRHSEDLDFFFATLQSKSELDKVQKRVVDEMANLEDATLVDKRWIKDEQSWRLFYGFEGNKEIIKIELLNFTCTRVDDTSFENSEIFKTENRYNLLLYKLKALCDRPDTIKDLFDIYFITRDLHPMKIDKLIKDINQKFECAIGIRYDKKHIVSALKHNLVWDIEIGNDIKHLHDLKLEINLFQKELQEMFENSEILDLSYKSRIDKKAVEFELSSDEYIEIIEENKFIVDEWKTLKRV